MSDFGVVSHCVTVHVVSGEHTRLAVRSAGELRLNVTVPPGCVGEVDVPGNASELVVSESGVVVWRRGAAAGTAEGVTGVAGLADGVRLSTVSGSFVVVAE